jgi:hypothetical protein
VAGEVLVTTQERSVLDAARLRQAGVTTIIMVGDSLFFMTSVDEIKWFPEWLVVPDAFGNQAYSAFAPATQMANAFAITPQRRMPDHIEERENYRAAREACPDPTCGVVHNALYEEFLLLFWGLQAAGPKLTIENVDRGLHAIPQQPSPNPWTPAAYFAPGNWSFVKDMMLARWDPAGVPPGQTPGCWRLVEYGKRYRTQDWATHPGDADFDRFDEWPCHVIA